MRCILEGRALRQISGIHTGTKLDEHGDCV